MDQCDPTPDKKEMDVCLLFVYVLVSFVSLACELSCSGRGQCDPITKQCSCDPFWTENLIRLYLGDGESNCGNVFIIPEPVALKMFPVVDL